MQKIIVGSIADTGSVYYYVNKPDMGLIESLKASGEN
jgi:hypothetical protein